MVRPPSGCVYTVYHIDHSHRKLKVHGSNSTCQYKVSCEVLVSAATCQYELTSSHKRLNLVIFSRCRPVCAAPRAFAVISCLQRARALSSRRASRMMKSTTLTGSRSLSANHGPGGCVLAWLQGSGPAKPQTTPRCEISDKRDARTPSRPWALPSPVMNRMS